LLELRYRRIPIGKKEKERERESKVYIVGVSLPSLPLSLFLSSFFFCRFLLCFPVPLSSISIPRMPEVSSSSIGGYN